MPNVKATSRKNDYGLLAEPLLPLWAMAQNAYMRDRSLTLFLVRLPRTGCRLWDCWQIDTRRKDGYATFGVRGSLVPGEIYAHRIVAAMVWGPIAEGLEVDHRCRVRNCVNPMHLRVCTLAENRERPKRWKPRRPFCPRGHRLVNVGLTKQGRCRECQRQDVRDYHARHRDELNAKRAQRKRAG